MAGLKADCQPDDTCDPNVEACRVGASAFYTAQSIVQMQAGCQDDAQCACCAESLSKALDIIDLHVAFLRGGACAQRTAKKGK